MRVIGSGVLASFWSDHADAKGPLLSWLSEARHAAWKTPHDVRARYPKVSLIRGHFVFNVHGNRYRLDVLIEFESGIVVVNRVGTHREYEDWTYAPPGEK